MYSLLRQLLFNFPPENVHHFSMTMLRNLVRFAPARAILERSFRCSDPALAKEVFGIRFPNPVGLGAGFDKNAAYLDELAALGFGFIEIGTVTPLPQPGNDKPRVFRLPKDRALINRMGFNNKGVKAVRGRIEHWKKYGRHPELVVGGNIGKNKITANEDAWKDYETCFRELFDVVDYFVVNVSSPNTPGLRALQEKDALSRILGNLQQVNAGMRKRKPLLLKIAPDLEQSQLDDIIALSAEVQLDGLVATNTTIARSPLVTDAAEVESMGAGGLSGAPLKERSTGLLRYITDRTEGKLPVIASGGIFTGTDAIERFNAGAALIQVWTGFIYEGPAIAANICRQLLSMNKLHNS
ncbi:MAG TPA: quinone-dependent dihydroorotate dehydrogenase [Chitinophagaceae bacterium]